MSGPDDWFESEEPTRLGMVAEAQRIQRRTRTRPIPVLIVAALLTGVIAYKLANRHPPMEAEVVLALTEGSLAQKHKTSVPVLELRAFVEGVLLPNAKLLELIEKHDLYKLRRTLGNEFAIEQLRSQIDIKIWKNTFIGDEGGNEHSARIGISVTDSNGDRAFELARDLATSVIETAQEQRQAVTKQISSQVTAMRDRLRTRFDELVKDTSEKQAALARARVVGNQLLVQSLDLQLAADQHELKKAATKLDQIASSRDALADQIAEAGLDMNVTVVDEHRPVANEHHNFVLVLIIFVVALGSLIGAALFVGAFDSRVHDVDDVERLGITVLGHLPGFPGDQVGSLQERGAARPRVPLSERLRWDSRR